MRPQVWSVFLLVNIDCRMLGCTISICPIMTTFLLSALTTVIDLTSAVSTLWYSRWQYCIFKVGLGSANKQGGEEETQRVVDVKLLHLGGMMQRRQERHRRCGRVLQFSSSGVQKLQLINFFLRYKNEKISATRSRWLSLLASAERNPYPLLHVLVCSQQFPPNQTFYLLVQKQTMRVCVF